MLSSLFTHDKNFILCLNWDLLSMLIYYVGPVLCIPLATYPLNYDTSYYSTLLFSSKWLNDNT